MDMEYLQAHKGTRLKNFTSSLGNFFVWFAIFGAIALVIFLKFSGGGDSNILAIVKDWAKGKSEDIEKKRQQNLKVHGKRKQEIKKAGSNVKKIAYNLTNWLGYESAPKGRNK